MQLMAEKLLKLQQLQTAVDSCYEDETIVGNCDTESSSLPGERDRQDLMFSNCLNQRVSKSAALVLF